MEGLSATMTVFPPAWFLTDLKMESRFFSLAFKALLTQLSPASPSFPLIIPPVLLRLQPVLLTFGTTQNCQDSSCISASVHVCFDYQLKVTTSIRIHFLSFCPFSVYYLYYANSLAIITIISFHVCIAHYS